MPRIAVIGAGVMGSGIAAHIVNAGYQVFLFDIVPLDKEERNFLAKQAIENLKKNQIFASNEAQDLIIPLNLEDNLDQIQGCDWVIEVIAEKLNLKKELYKKLLSYKKPSCIISSNTSTIKLSDLLQDMPHDFKQKFYITHFFNPPRYMRLLELVTHQENLLEDIDFLKEFCFKSLGKEVVLCYDTPGFIANRLGCYWLEVSMREAEKLNLSPSLIDQALNKSLSIPKTGIFGLYDLIGLDLMQLIAQSLTNSLPADDLYVVETRNYPDFYLKLIKENYIGRKGKGGFYRLDGKQKQELNFKTGQFENVPKHDLSFIHNFKDLFHQDNNISTFICTTFLKFIHYTLTHAANIAHDILSIDQAMKMGYGWKLGPFELIDQLGKHFIYEELTKRNMNIPDLIKVNDLPFYQKREYLEFSGNYTTFPSTDIISLSSFREKRHPVYSSGSCNLWDIGDGVVCLELTSKMNSLNYDIFESIIKIVDYINDTGTKLVIGSDKDVFSTGANLEYFLKAVENENFNEIENFITIGQKAFNYIQESTEKIVSAVSGYALGGGCELLMHTHQVAAHIESYIGLVEPTIGLIPGWGGCKQIMSKNIPEFYPQLLKNIFLGKTSNSAKEAVEMHILDKNDLIIMNKDLLLTEAKKLALQPKIALYNSYQPVKTLDLHDLKSLAKDANHLLVLEKLSQIFTSSSFDIINQLEKDCFMSLIKTVDTQSKMKLVLNKNR